MSASYDKSTRSEMGTGMWKWRSGSQPRTELVLTAEEERSVGIDVDKTATYLEFESCGEMGNGCVQNAVRGQRVANSTYR